MKRTPASGLKSPKTRLSRSETMARVKAVNTSPELVVRRALHAAGLRYRLHCPDLPGKPDIVLRRRKAIVRVNGCFWHSHPGCKRARIPLTRQHYWHPKLERNVARDRATEAELELAGWRVLTVWECELKTSDRLSSLVDELKEIQ